MRRQLSQLHGTAFEDANEDDGNDEEEDPERRGGGSLGRWEDEAMSMSATLAEENAAVGSCRRCRRRCRRRGGERSLLARRLRCGAVRG